MSGPHELPEDFITKWMEKYERKVEALEEAKADEIVAERKRNDSVFSDAQTARIESYMATALAVFLGSDAFNKAQDIRLELNAGRQAIRFVVWLVCSFVAGASVVAVAWLKHQG